MKLTYIILFILFFLNACSPVIKPHGYQLGDILIKEPQVVGKSNKTDVYNSYGSPSIKIEDIDNTWLYIASSKQKKVFSNDEFLDQIIFAFNFDANDTLVSQEIYDKNQMLNIENDKNKTFDYGTNYSLLDQIYDAFTRGL